MLILCCIYMLHVWCKQFGINTWRGNFVSSPFVSVKAFGDACRLMDVRQQVSRLFFCLGKSEQTGCENFKNKELCCFDKFLKYCYYDWNNLNICVHVIHSANDCMYCLAYFLERPYCINIMYTYNKSALCRYIFVYCYCKHYCYNYWTIPEFNL